MSLLLAITMFVQAPQAAPARPAAVPPTAPATGPEGAPATAAPAEVALGAAPPVAPAAAARAPFADVGALLDAVEAITETLRDFRADVTLETTDDITGDTERRMGKVVFLQEAGKPQTRQFAVVFEKFIDGSGRMDEKPMRYIYADGWLTEADFTQQTLIRRQLARPGEAYDPLKPGDGPVPLPIGQRKADVLKRFEASLATTPPHGSLAKLEHAQGVVMTPRPGMADRDLVQAIVWYDLETLAPVGVEAKKKNGTTIVLLRRPALNAGLDDAQRALLSLAAGATQGWRVDERPLAAPGGAQP